MSSILPSSSSAGTATAAGTPLTSTASQGTVSSTGLGSGLDINSIVTQLVAAEGNGPTTLLNSRQTQIQSKLSAYGQFQAAVSALQASLATLATTAQFQSNSASVGDPAVASAAADTTAAAGTYSLSVVQLASGAKLVSAPQAAATSAIGTGTLTVKVGSAAIAVTIDSSNNTLAGIAAAITKAGSANGIAATLLTANDGVRLVLTSATTGAANAVTVTQSGGDGGLAALVYDPANSNTTLTQVQAPQDAQIKLDGFTYNSASNVVTGALGGVTINLKAASTGAATTPLTIAVDQSSAQKAVQTFVSSYNALATAVTQLSSYNATTGSGGPLLGDSVLGSFVRQLNNAIDSSVPSLANGPFGSLAEIGIVANTDGTLSADSNRLNAAFTSHYASVAQLFAGSDGLAGKLNNLLDQYTKPTTGVFAQQTASLQQNLKDIAAQRSALTQRMADLQARLLAQYNAMDALVAQLKSTGTSVQAQLSSIYYPGKASTAVP